MRYCTIKELPEFDRPREKLLELGASSLSDSELIAIILRTGSRGKNALDLARELLRHFGSVHKLSEAHIEELLRFRGLGKTKAVTLVAALELGKRALSNRGRKNRITSPEEALQLIDRFRHSKMEVFGVITLNVKGVPIGVHEISKGGVSSVSITPKEVFYPVIRDLSSAMIVFHNHPSGNVEPSREDIELTEKLLKIASELEVQLLDHIIISSSDYFSFAKAGML